MDVGSFFCHRTESDLFLFLLKPPGIENEDFKVISLSGE